MNRRIWWGLPVIALLAARCGGNPEIPRGDGSGGQDGTGGSSDSDASAGGGGTGGFISVSDGSCNGPCDTGGTDGGFFDAGAPFCGDGALNQASEVCDDGNAVSGDGCSEVCAAEANYICSNPGQPCVKTVICGDGAVAGDEQCDDRNTKANDGCSATCALESGWTCPFPGLRCIADKCGDSIIAGVEECDDGASATPGCDANCRVEDGYKCDVPGQPCTVTTCRDGKAEGTEQCDDGNFDLGDGCSPFCKLEPDCSQGACISKCGDGIVLGAEDCDDGNQRDGDGCSADCKVELGFTCTRPPLPPQLSIPLVVRDAIAVDPNPATSTNPVDYVANNHVDYELVTGSPKDEPSGTEDGAGTNARIVRNGAGSTATGRGKDLGQPGETFDIQRLDGTKVATVSLAGKPVYSKSRAQCDKTLLPDAANAWAKCTVTTMDADSFHSWYVDKDSTGKAITWPKFLAKGQTVLESMTLLRGAFDETSANFVAGGDAYTFDSRYMLIDGTQPPVIANVTPKIRTAGFFPADELGNTGTTSNPTEPHNFHFTSEVRFWFEYDSSTTPRLDFSGDDDVWVYVNGHLALDIGGIHGRAVKNFTIDATNAAAWGLADGKVYEIAVFQAERNQNASNYWLTLRGFNASKSVCESICGDGILASDELCDDGKGNQSTSTPDYGKCSSDCKKRGPNCGDGKTDKDHEECDDGVNTSVYDFNGQGCAPGCVKPPSCGDGELQASNEECDDGDNTSEYGGCGARCRLAPRCGDGKVQRNFGEDCDDGPSGSSSCSTTCSSRGPR